MLAEAERDQAKFAADAEAYRMTTLAAARSQAARIEADAAAYAARAKAEAEADANTARANSLKGGNQEVIAANLIVEDLPSLVEAASQGIAASNLTIVNGAEGVSQVIAGLVGQGLSILDTLKKSTAPAGPKDAVALPITDGNDVPTGPAAGISSGNGPAPSGAAAEG